MSLGAEKLRIEEKVVLREIFSSDEPETKALLAAVLSMTEEGLEKTDASKDKQLDTGNSGTKKLKDHSPSRDESEEEEEEWSDDDYAVIKAYYENEEEDIMDLPYHVGLSSIIKERQLDIVSRTDNDDKMDSRHYYKSSPESASLPGTGGHDSYPHRNDQQFRRQPLTSHKEEQLQLENNDNDDNAIVNTDSDTSSSAANDSNGSDSKQRSKDVQMPDALSPPPRKKSRRSGPAITAL